MGDRPRRGPVQVEEDQACSCSMAKTQRPRVGSSRCRTAVVRTALGTWLTPGRAGQRSRMRHGRHDPTGPAPPRTPPPRRPARPLPRARPRLGPVLLVGSGVRVCATLTEPSSTQSSGRLACRRAARSMPSAMAWRSEPPQGRERVELDVSSLLVLGQPTPAAPSAFGVAERRGRPSALGHVAAGRLRPPVLGVGLALGLAGRGHGRGGLAAAVAVVVGHQFASPRPSPSGPPRRSASRLSPSGGSVHHRTDIGSPSGAIPSQTGSAVEDESSAIVAQPR